MVAARTCSPDMAGRVPGAMAGGGATSGSSVGRCGAHEAPVASSRTARASSFSAPKSSPKVGSTDAGLAAQRAYCSPRNAAFAPLKADARMSTPAIGQNPCCIFGDAANMETLTGSRRPEAALAGMLLPHARRRGNVLHRTRRPRCSLLRDPRGAGLRFQPSQPGQMVSSGCQSLAPYRHTVGSPGSTEDISMPFPTGFAGPRPPAIARWLALIPTAILSLAATASAQGQSPPPQVTVATPFASRVAQWDEFTGRFEAVPRVEVRPRVSGYIDKVNFRDGINVKEGDLLFTIDQRPLRLAVESAAADVIRTKALDVLDEADYERAQQLVKTAATPGRELDQRKANLDIARAQVLSAEAA